MANYMKVSVENTPRVELHNKLGLTGAEISINTILNGECVPFVHSHKQNEEIYYVIGGSGKAVVDNEEINLIVGDWLRISPKAERQFFASKDNSISYICIQVKENSLEEFTANDAIIKYKNPRVKPVDFIMAYKALLRAYHLSGLIRRLLPFRLRLFYLLPLKGSLYSFIVI